MRKTILLLLGICFMQNINAQSIVYYRNILMNHMTPRMELKGLHPISAVTADGVAHYKFTYDEQGRTTEIINSHPSVRGKHPLTDLGAYQVRIVYTQSTETRTYFDKEENQIRNLREVAKEVYSYDADGFKTGLSYYDEQDKPIASGWNVAKYEWSKRDSFVLEKRYDLQGEPQVLAPFFTLGSTLIEYDDRGFITAQYNLDEQLEKAAHPTGMASYHDIHDQNGNIILIQYRDLDGKLINAADGNFSTILYVRDHFGNATESRGIDENGKQIWHDIHTYDEKGNKLNNQ